MIYGGHEVILYLMLDTIVFGSFLKSYIIISKAEFLISLKILHFRL